MLILSDSGVLTATTQLFLLNSIARRQRAAPSWAAAGERLFTTRASISVSYALLARLKPRWYHLRPSRLHRIYYGAVRAWTAHRYFRPHVIFGFSMLHQRFACARLSHPYMTRSKQLMAV